MVRDSAQPWPDSASLSRAARNAGARVVAPEVAAAVLAEWTTLRLQSQIQPSSDCLPQASTPREAARPRLD